MAIINPSEPSSEAQPVVRGLAVRQRRWLSIVLHVVMMFDPAAGGAENREMRSSCCLPAGRLDPYFLSTKMYLCYGRTEYGRVYRRGARCALLHSAKAGIIGRPHSQYGEMGRIRTLKRGILHSEIIRDTEARSRLVLLYLK